MNGRRYGFILISTAVVLLLISVGICTGFAFRTRKQVMARGNAEAMLAAKQLDAWLDRILATAQDEAVIAEEIMKKGLSHADLEEQLRERNWMLSTTVHPAIRNVVLTSADWYACGNWWTPPKGYRPESRPWFPQLSAGVGHAVLTDPYPALDLNTPCVTAGGLLSDGKTICAIDVDLSAFSETARNSLNGDSLEVIYRGPNGLQLGEAGKIAADSKYVEFTAIVKGGWQTLVRMERSKVNSAIRDAIIIAGIWCSIISLLVMFLTDRLLNHRDDKPSHGDLIAVAVLLFIAGVFIVILFAVHRTATARERAFAIHLGTEEVRKSVEEFDDFLHCAQASTEYAAKHVESLLRKQVNDQELFTALRALNDDLRSVYGMNYKNVYAARKDWIVNSLGWVPPPDFDFSKREWYRRATAAPGKTIVTSPYRAAEDEMTEITIARMLPDEKRTIVAIDITLQMLDSFTARIGIGGAKCAMIITPDGDIICHRSVGESKEIHDLACQQRVAQRALAEKSSFMMKDDSGRDIVVFLTPIRFGGRAVVCADADIINRFVEQQGLDELMFMATLFVAALFFAWFAFRRIRRGHLAEAANLAKSAFLFNMSHDIRTPMNAIIGYTNSALHHGDDPARINEILRKIKMSGEHLLNLINDILEMSRIESGKLTLAEHPLDIREAFEGVCQMGQALAIPRSIEFKSVLGELKNPYILADELHISEIIINLISNAVKYTRDGGLVEYHAEQISEAHEGIASYRFTVKDNGIGMSDEFQKHLFESFSREATATVSKQEGAGLGLAIVKRIVELAGGSISMQSKQNVGSTFVVELPFRVMDEAAVQAFMATRKQDETIAEEAVLEGKKVLLVEDNEMNREIATEILTDAGMVVYPAEDGAIAVKVVSEKGPDYYDFILMDIQMPIMNGYEATKAIRKMPGGDRMKIIALSANAFEEDRQKSLAAGMNAHEAKPIKVKSLLETIRSLTK